MITRTGEGVTLVGYGMGDLARRSCGATWPTSGSWVWEQLMPRRQWLGHDAAATFVVPAPRSATATAAVRPCPRDGSTGRHLLSDYRGLLRSREPQYVMLASGYGAFGRGSAGHQGRSIDRGTGRRPSRFCSGLRRRVRMWVAMAGWIPSMNASSGPRAGRVQVRSGPADRGPGSGWPASVAVLAVLVFKRWSRCRGACAGERSRTVRAD